MQMFPYGVDLHEMSQPIFCENSENISLLPAGLAQRCDKGTFNPCPAEPGYILPLQTE